MQFIFFVSSYLLSSLSLAQGIPQFLEVTDRSGVEHQYTGDWEFFVGGGVTVFDCNQDFKPEIFIAGGESNSALYLNDSEVGGALRFKQLPQLQMDRVTGAYALNIDGDGIADLVILRHGENHVFRGLGDCQFEHANERWALPGGQNWTTAFSATWEGDNEFPTLAFGNYIDQTQAGSPFGTCADHRIFRPSNDAYENPFSLTGYCSLSMLFTDWDRSGSADLRSANDRQYYRGGHEQLWNFRDHPMPVEYTEADGWANVQLWGMGIAHQDIDGDGYYEYFVTSMADNKLTQLLPRARGPSYENIAYEKGATLHRPFVGDSVMPSTAWHAQFEDVNNDTYSDLFVVKGNVEAMTDFAQEDPNNLLLGHAKGHFEEIADTANFLSVHRGRGGSLADFNLDGLLDAVVVNRKENAQIWQNLGQGKGETAAPMGNWLNVLLKQPDHNIDAIGAVIELRIADRTLTREVVIGGGHVGNTLHFHHFGMGVAERAKFRVHWPDDSTSAWVNVLANQFVLLEKGETQAKVWLP